MQKLSLLLGLIFLSTFSWAKPQITWDEYLTSKVQNVSHSRHLPYLLSHGKKTEKSVLLIHGTYSSPLHFRGMAHAFFNQGYNVVTLLLPGHWEKDLYSMKTTQEAQFVKEADMGFEMAKVLGDRVIVAGHSLGGLLAIEQGLKRSPREMHSVVLISPAIKLRDTVVLAARAGKALKLTGNTFTLSKPNGFDIPDYSPRAGLLLASLQKKIPANELKLPVYLAFTWGDIVLDPGALKKFYENVKSPVKKIRTYGRFSGINHDNICQGGDDLLTFLSTKPNSDFELMMNDAVDFIESVD